MGCLILDPDFSSFTPTFALTLRWPQSERPIRIAAVWGNLGTNSPTRESLVVVNFLLLVQKVFSMLPFYKKISFTWAFLSSCCAL